MSTPRLSLSARPSRLSLPARAPRSTAAAVSAATLTAAATGASLAPWPGPGRVGVRVRVRLFLLPWALWICGRRLPGSRHRELARKRARHRVPQLEQLVTQRDNPVGAPGPLAPRGGPARVPLAETEARRGSNEAPARGAAPRKR